MAAGDVETVFEGGQWLTRVRGVGGALAKFSSKEQAVEHARQEAIDRDVEHLIKRIDGTIVDRNTYRRVHEPEGMPD